MRVIPIRGAYSHRDSQDIITVSVFGVVGRAVISSVHEGLKYGPSRLRGQETVSNWLLRASVVLEAALITEASVLVHVT